MVLTFLVLPGSFSYNVLWLIYLPKISITINTPFLLQCLINFNQSFLNILYFHLTHLKTIDSPIKHQIKSF